MHPADQTVPGQARALVTGASGFLGAHLVAALAARGVAVTALVRQGSDPGRLRRLAPGVVPVTCGLDDRDGLDRLMVRAAPETVYHLAGDTGVRHFGGGRAAIDRDVIDWDVIDRALAANVAGALNVVRAAIRAGSVRRVIRTGGLEEYGGGPPAPETQREAPISPYSAAQVTVTQWFAMLQAHTRVMLVTLRPALVYGPGQGPGFLIPALIAALLAGGRFAMGAGHQRRDLIYVDDMTRALLLAGGRDDLHGAVINLATGRAEPMAAVAQRLAARLGAEDRLDIGARPPRPMDLGTVSGCPGLAAARLGWRAEVTLEDGLDRTLAWHRALRDGGIAGDAAP